MDQDRDFLDDTADLARALPLDIAYMLLIAPFEWLRDRWRQWRG